MIVVHIYECTYIWNLMQKFVKYHFIVHFVHFYHCHLQKSAGLSLPTEHFIPKVQQEQQISGKEGQLCPEQQPEWGQPAPRIRVFRQWAEQEETIQWGRGKGSWQSYCPWSFTEANDIHAYMYIDLKQIWYKRCSHKTKQNFEALVISDAASQLFLVLLNI